MSKHPNTIRRKKSVAKLEDREGSLRLQKWIQESEIPWNQHMKSKTKIPQLVYIQEESLKSEKGRNLNIAHIKIGTKPEYCSHQWYEKSEQGKTVRIDV